MRRRAPPGRRWALRVLALGCALAAALAPAFAEARVLSVEFDPPRYVSGDRVRAYLTWDDAGVSWFPETVRTGLPEPAGNGPTILSAALATRIGRSTLVVEFTPWRPGPGMLPPLTVGGVSFPPVPFDAASALASAEGYSPRPLPQLEPEGLRARVYAIAAILLGLAAASLLAAFRLVPWLKAILRRWTWARARKEFDALLDYLGSSSPATADGWALLGAGLRRYLCARADANFLSLTPRELVSAASGCLPAGAGESAADILAVVDRVRFAGAPADGLDGAVSRARALADLVEESAARADGTGAESGLRSAGSTEGGPGSPASGVARGNAP